MKLVCGSTKSEQPSPTKPPSALRALLGVEP